LKKLTSSVRIDFGFISLKLKKPNQTEPNWKKTEPNWSQTGLNRFCPNKPNRTETGRFELVSAFFKKKFGLVTFFDKNQPKMITSKNGIIKNLVNYFILFYFIFHRYIIKNANTSMI
jgi:hypothetical protein